MDYVDINVAIAENKGYAVEVDGDDVYAGKKYDGNVIGTFGIFNPVQDIRQAMSLVFEKRISIDFRNMMVYPSDQTSITEMEEFESDEMLPYAICSLYLKIVSKES